jgi:prepilin peptidase CpaA
VGQALSVPFGIVLIAAMVAAVTDLWKFKVHNLLTLPLLGAGLLYHGLTGGLAGLAESSLGALCGFAIMIIFYLLGGMGAGDVKLMAGVGAWLGMPLTFSVFLASGLAAGVYAVVLIVTYGKVRETWVNLQILWLRLAAIGRHLAADDCVESEVSQAGRRRRVIPFAAMMVLGLVVLLACARLAGRP